MKVQGKVVEGARVCVRALQRLDMTHESVREVHERHSMTQRGCPRVQGVHKRYGAGQGRYACVHDQNN